MSEVRKERRTVYCLARGGIEVTATIKPLGRGAYALLELTPYETVSATEMVSLCAAVKEDLADWYSTGVRCDAEDREIGLPEPASPGR